MPPVAKLVTRITSVPPGAENWLVAAMAFLPGAMAGVQMAGLLFFLDPDLPFAAGPLIRGTLVFGALWGLMSMALLMPVTWGRIELAQRILPWAIVVVLALSALIDWLHASHLSFYMTPGINTRLIKAAVGLSVAALVGFYTALLHSLHDRPYGPRSRLLMVALVLVSVWVMIERREAFKPWVEQPRAAAVERQPRPALWVIGIEGATLDALLPLAEEGRLPFFASLLENGAYARLSSYAPRRRSALWTSLSTGVLPHRHGVLDDRTHSVPFLVSSQNLRLAPVSASVTHWGMLGAPSFRVDSGSSDLLTTWQILRRLGVSYGLIGWPLTDPVPDEAVFAFSDRFFEGQFRRSSALPKELAERGTLFRPAIDEIDPTQVLGPETDLSPAVGAALEQDLWRESLASFMLEQEPSVGAVLLHLPGLARISQAYLGAYHAVHFEGKQDPAMQAAAAYLIRYYEYLDRTLERLVSRIREPRVVAIVSAYGYEAPRGWSTLPRRVLRRDPWRGTSTDAPDGVLMMTGPGVEPGTLLAAAELADTLPTIFYALGLPIARDLDGRVLTAAFSNSFLATQPLTFLPSYEALGEPAEPAAGEASIASIR